MSRTRKKVVATLIATLEGDYIPADQADQYLESWVTSGLDDRDDLRGWDLNILAVVESTLDDDDAEDDGD